MFKNHKTINLILSLVFILILFHLSYGFQIILPSNINWLMSVYHDWGQHYLGWAYFQNEPWHFPIGKIENYNFPEGTNIGFTDSIPLLAIFFKSISFLLPETFQYFGIWFLSCHLLMGYFTFKLLNLFTNNYALIILSVLLISFNPVLMYRGIHPALCAQWLLVASIYFYLLTPSKKNVDLINKKQLILLLVSALINPYLFLMVFGFNLILTFKNYFFDKVISFKKMLAYNAIGVALVLFSWYIIGMITFSGNKNIEVVSSYGLYGLNLNSFFNSSGWSSFFIALDSYNVRQYEGYAYLGLGLMIFLSLSFLFFIFLVIKNKVEIKKYYKFYPFLILLIAYLLFAISNKVTFHQTLLFEYQLPGIIIKLGNIFRASGRFVWIFYYTIILFFIIVFIKIKIHKSIKVTLLLLITIVQFYDIKLFFNKNLAFGNYEIQPLNEKKWTAISSNFDKIITYPLYNNSLGYNSDYQDWCFIALKSNLPITNGYVARESGDKNVIYQQRIKYNIASGIINNNDLYVITPQNLADFNTLIYRQQVHLGFLDGFYYLYSKENTKMKDHLFSEVELQKEDSIFSKINNLSQVQIIDSPNISENKIQFNLENFTFNNNVINAQGWAFHKNSLDSTKDAVVIALTSHDKSYLFKTNKVERLDVSGHFKNEKLKDAGFMTSFFTDKLESGNYTILLGIESEGAILFQSANQQMIEIKKQVQVKLLKSLPEFSETIKHKVELVSQEDDLIYVIGWAFKANKSAVNSKIQLVLEGENNIYAIDVNNVNRPDVTAYFNDDFNYDNSGFKLTLKKEKIKKGNYKIGIIITTDDKKSFFNRSDKVIKI